MFLCVSVFYHNNRNVANRGVKENGNWIISHFDIYIYENFKKYNKNKKNTLTFEISYYMNFLFQS